MLVFAGQKYFKSMHFMYIVFNFRDLQIVSEIKFG